MIVKMLEGKITSKVPAQAPGTPATRKPTNGAMSIFEPGADRANPNKAKNWVLVIQWCAITARTIAGNVLATAPKASSDIAIKGNRFASAPIIAFPKKRK